MKIADSPRNIGFVRTDQFPKYELSEYVVHDSSNPTYWNVKKFSSSRSKLPSSIIQRRQLCCLTVQKPMILEEIPELPDWNVCVCMAHLIRGNLVCLCQKRVLIFAKAFAGSKVHQLLEWP